MAKYNTFWRRLVAAFIDGLILYPVTLIETIANNSTSPSLFILGGFISTLLYITYFITLHGKYGQTLGKKLMSIKVVDINEASLIGFKRATIRELPWIVASSLAFVYLLVSLFIFKNKEFNSAKDDYHDLSFIITFTWLIIELITMLINPKRRAIHDFLAKAVVIKI